MTRTWQSDPVDLQNRLCNQITQLRAEVERLRTAATKATKAWHRESSPNSIKIYKAMEALERSLEPKP